MPALLLSLALGALAQELGEVDESGEDAPAPAVAVESFAAEASSSPRLERALQALYRLDYTVAEAEAETFISERPGNPYGELFAAGQLWWRSATELLRASEDPVLASRFDAHSRRAVAKSKPLFKSDKPRLRAEAYFVAGMSLGLRGQWRLTNRQWFKAYLDGKKAIKYLRRCVEIDPGLHDASLGLGIFDYQSAVLPGVLRLGALLLVRGDRERGLERIRLAMEKGSFARRQAASFLLTIYQNTEKDHGAALELTRALLRDFPESVYYAGVEAQTLTALGRTAEATEAWARVYAMLRGPDLKRLAWGVLCGPYGESCLAEPSLVAAEAWANVALSSPPKDPAPGWEAAVRLVRGLSRDARKRGSAARADYDAVLADGSADPYARRLAQSCKHQPCTAERLLALRLERR